MLVELVNAGRYLTDHLQTAVQVEDGRAAEHIMVKAIIAEALC